MKLKRILAVVLSTTMALSTAAFALPAAAEDPVVGGSFSSSFEEGDASPLENTVEYSADGKAMTENVTKKGAGEGLVGKKKAKSVTAPKAYNDHEIADNLLDDNAGSKYLTTSNRPFNIDFEMSEPTTIRVYSITSANDAPERDPKSWTLYGSVDGSEWVQLDKQENQKFADRYVRNTYEIKNETAYTYYRVTVEANGSGSMTQIGDITFGTNDPADDQAAAIGMGAEVLGGPGSTWNSTTGKGFTGSKTYTVSGTHEGSGRAYSHNVVYDNLNIPVSADTQLSYKVFPQFDGDYDYEYTSTYVAVDLQFEDGTYLSDLMAVDQYGNKMDAQSQGDSKFLLMRQWNHVYSNIGQVAAGKTIKKILINYDKASNATTTTNEEGEEVPANASFEALFDDIDIKDVAPVEHARKSDYVSILRGTQSSGSFSRGLNGALVTVPHSFNFWAPTTNSGQASMYTYQPGNTFKHISTSHVASHWIGDRGNYTFMVNTSIDASNSNSVGVNERAASFSHDNEVAKAHYYKVAFDEGSAASGATLELAPTNHAAMMRFTFDENVENRNVILDCVTRDADLKFSEDGKTFTAAVKENSNGMGTMYVYGEFSVAPELDKITNAKSGQGVVSFADGTNEVTLKVATSFISADQAKHNMDLEIAKEDTFDDIKEMAQSQWDDKLDIIDVEGATENQLTTLYSNMYRLFAYPNLMSENVGTNEEPQWQYRSPYNDKGVVDGTFYYNNGFWDTYRTTWAAYALLTPSKNTELLNGLVQHYNDEGWVPRWIAPAGVNSMVGTNSDVIFGDALLRGQEFDYETAYDAALRNASAVSSKSQNGRQNINQSIFYGYTGANNGEGMSWGLEGFINDAGIANMAKAMMDKMEDKNSEEYQKLNDEYIYFTSRATNYVNYFKYNDNGDGDGWFKGKNYNGTWQTNDDSFNPKSWGGQYTETNAWNMAFTAPQDGQGLANLYGGRDGLAAKLDAFFNEDTTYIPGGYGGEIHEMREARQVRMGQYGHSNQPSHHIPYMYNYAGQPYKTQEKVREIMDRLYSGYTIGQGYCGDEDNGEMSAWYILSSLGLYPVNMGSGEFAIGSPLFEKATVHLENGKDLVINAKNNSRENVYVQSLEMEGEAYNKTYFDQVDLVNGDKDNDGEITLDFVMGDKPSTWGTAEDSVPPSITTGDKVVEPLKDMTSEDAQVAETANQLTGVTPGIYVEGLAEGAKAANLLDNNSNNATAFAGNTGSVTYFFGDGNGKYIDMYTITGKATNAAPTSWTVYGSNDGNEWTEIDSRSNQTFQWANYTRPFAVDEEKSAKYTYVKIDFTGAEAMNLGEIELMGIESKSVDKASLQAFIDQVNAMDGSAYADVTFQALLDAAKAAQAVVDNPESTQEDYVEAYQSVQTALDNLKEIRDAYARLEAESFDNASSGIKAESTSDTNVGDVGNIGGTAPGAWIAFKYVDFGTVGAEKVSVNYAGVIADCPNAHMEVRLDSVDGEVIADIQTPPSEGAWKNYMLATADLTKKVTGQHDVYVVLHSTGKHVANIDYFQFTEAENTDAPTEESIAALNAALEAAAALNPEDFTEESFASLTAAVENGNAVKNNPDATNAMYVDATERINTAIEELDPAEPQPSGDIISASLDRDPAVYDVNEEITLTAVTKDTISDVNLRNENDRYISRTWVKSVNNGDGTKTWTIKFSVGTAGENRTMSLYTRTMGSSYEDSGMDITMTIANPEYNGMVLSVENAASAKVNEEFAATITTTGDVEDIRVLNERGNVISLLSKDATVDEETGTKTWNVTLSVGSAGNNRIFSVVTVNPYTGKVVDNGMTMQVSITK